MTAQAHNRFVFCVVVVEFAVNGNQALLTHADPTFVSKLNINNHKTVSNEKGMNNLSNHY